MIQEEVLMDEGMFKQISEPTPYMENGRHKVEDGIPYYYVDFEELVKPIKK